MPSSFLTLSLLLILMSCQYLDSSLGHELRERDLNRIEVMSYNLENLFDTQHDVKGKRHLQDYMYLPKDSPFKRSGCQKVRSNYWQKKCFETDWTQEKLALKISQLARVVKRGERDVVPDILAVSEIENEVVAKMLAEELGMEHFVITSGDDERGIELALFYHDKNKHGLKLESYQEHKLEGKTTRSILETQFLVKGKYPLVIYVNHWPSQGSPSMARVEQANLLAELMNKKRKEVKEAHFLALGDFNTLETEAPHPFRDALLKKTDLFDLNEIFHQSEFVEQNKKSKLSLGTYFYAPKMSWNLLDRVFLGPKLYDQEGMDVLPESYEIYAPSFAVEKYIVKDKSSQHFGSVIQGTPKRANFNTLNKDKAGYSDHFPIVLSLVY